MPIINPRFRAGALMCAFFLPATFIVLPSVFCPLSSAFAQGGIIPSGTPTPLFKTLHQVEPRTDLQAPTLPPGVTTDANYHFIISQRGSYYLSANLDVSTKTNGIRINAEGVTLDLNGFQISRTSGSGGIGIEITAFIHRASIRNGSIKGFSSGVESGNSRSVAFRDLAVSGCTFAGISAGRGSVLEACRADGNSGFFAIIAGTGSSLTNCTANENTASHGIFAGGGSSLINCTASDNTATNAGISASIGSSLTNCTAVGNTAPYGIFASNGSSLTNCTASLNESTASVSAGIGAAEGCTLSHCSSFENRSTAPASPGTGMGIVAGLGSNVLSCTAKDNKGDGIRVSDNCQVAGNTCDTNGLGVGTGAGIHVTGSANRIESNNTTNNDTGILVDAAGNFIIKNSTRGGGAAFTFAAGNSHGEFINVWNAGSGAIIMSSNPWANFTY